MKLLVTRPAEDAADFSRRLVDCGVVPVMAPLIEIGFDSGLHIDLDETQAVLLTSANGARALADATDERRVLVVCVGPATAAAARQAGFTEVEAAGGDVDQLAAAVRRRLRPQDGPLLHVAGSTVAGDLRGTLERAGFFVRRVVGYSATAAERLPEAAEEALRAGDLDGAAFFSPRTAATFVKLVQAAGLDGGVSELDAYCLSAAVADRCGALSWHAVHVAATPDGEALATLICAHAGRR